MTMAPSLQTLLDLEFTPRSAVVRTARDATSVVVPDLSRERRDDVRLLVSEIVTNSVQHGEPGPERWIRLRVECGEGMVRVEVRNPGAAIAFERPARSNEMRESGWGLYLLENLADRWGVSNAAGETCVWFEVDQER
jgi:anti-sigma regulatory factor (Ser/Thr protein kinase)